MDKKEQIAMRNAFVNAVTSIVIGLEVISIAIRVVNIANIAKFRKYAKEHVGEV